MKCTNPKMKTLVNLYQFNLLPEEQKIGVEAHLLECEACFEELYRISPVLEILEGMPERFLDALQPRETFFIRTINLLRQQVESLKRTSDLISDALIRWWERPAAKILVPVTAAILLAMFYFIPPYLLQPTEYSDLAILEKADYKAYQFRGRVELTPAQQLFDEGMKLYEQDKYAKAIPQLAAYLEREPDIAYAHFYLGISLLLEDEIDGGIKHLKLASDLSQEQGNKELLEKSYWYLGNAYLKTNDVENALREFRQIVTPQGDLEAKAKKQITKIEEMRKEKVRN